MIYLLLHRTYYKIAFGFLRLEMAAMYWKSLIGDKRVDSSLVNKFFELLGNPAIYYRHGDQERVLMDDNEVVHVLRNAIESEEYN